MTPRHPPARVLQALLAKWRLENVQPHPAADATQVRDAFAAAGGVATSDLVRLYGVLGGMDIFEDNGWMLWPLDLVGAGETRSNGFGTVFSDYLISSWLFRAKPVSEDVSEVYADFCDGTEPTWVAASLDAFLEALAFRPMSVLEPRAGPSVQRRGSVVTLRAASDHH